jgi:hypothetical protein
MRLGSRLVTMSLTLCALAAPVLAQAPLSRPSTRVTHRNDVSIELLGKAALYSFGYQRMVTPALGLEVGIGAIGGGSASENTTVVFFPLGAKLYVIPKDGSLFLAGGMVVVSASVESGPFNDEAADTYGYAGLGFEFRSTGGFLFRGAAYGLFAGGSYFIWPGVTLGYAF